ncbi:MAG: hypothetical protein J6126_05585, partial [Clostridia bacterium]|nr:hypothetical protein [Clostridia bacterium]
MSKKRKTILYFLVAMLISAALFAVVPEVINTSLRPVKVKAEEYNINSAEEFKAYSIEYKNGNRNPQDTLKIVINSGNTVTDFGFASLGTYGEPFAGTISVTAVGIGTFHLFNCPLFDYVSTDAVITVSGGDGSIQIIREKLPDAAIPTGALSSGALFANHVVKGTNPANWNITLQTYDGGDENSGDAPSFANLIGDIADECDVTVKFTNNTSMPVSSTGDAGLICGTLGEEATLAVETAGSGGSISVTSSGGNAGSLVGKMGADSTLTLKSANNSHVTEVTASNGYAGGLVGRADDSTVKSAAGVSGYTVSGTVSGKSGAGGLFGYYKKTGGFTFDMAGISDELADFTITSG